jgi:hypothetical protein
MKCLSILVILVVAVTLCAAFNMDACKNCYESCPFTTDLSQDLSCKHAMDSATECEKTCHKNDAECNHGCWDRSEWLFICWFTDEETKCMNKCKTFSECL